MDEFSRIKSLLGEEPVENLHKTTVAVFGIGGVGGYATEALARSGIGKLVLVDNDRVSLSNINRQIIALHSTIGRYKTEVMEERVREINPRIQVETHTCFFLPENAAQFDFAQYDYVIDAVDTVTAKLEIIMRAKAAGVPVISAMGTGNKLDASRFIITDISKTKMCPLAKVMRKELKTRGIGNVKVVYSEEPALTPKVFRKEADEEQNDRQTTRRSTPGSIAYVPAVAGLLLAQEVITGLTSGKKEIIL